MAIDAARFSKFLNDVMLEQLFNELGWDHAGTRPEKVTVNGENFTLKPIAHKRRVVVFMCSPGGEGNIPPPPHFFEERKRSYKTRPQAFPDLRRCGQYHA